MKTAIIANRSIGYARKASKYHDHAVKMAMHWRLFSSTTPRSATIKDLYCWGTSDKGTIPTKEALESGRGAVSSGDASLVNLDRLKGSTGTIIDRPTKIDIQDAFGIGK